MNYLAPENHSPHQCTLPCYSALYIAHCHSYIIHRLLSLLYYALVTGTAVLYSAHRYCCRSRDSNNAPAAVSDTRAQRDTSRCHGVCSRSWLVRDDGTALYIHWYQRWWDCSVHCECAVSTPRNQLVSKQPRLLLVSLYYRLHTKLDHSCCSEALLAQYKIVAL